MKNVMIIGAGGHAKVIAEIVIKNGDNVIGFLDDNKRIFNKDIYCGKKVMGTLDDIGKYKDNYFIIGIGNNIIRKKISLKYNYLKWYTAIHPSAVVANDVKINEGTVIMPGVVINPGTYIGKHVIINTCSSIDHDNYLSDYVHISPGAHLSGSVKIGKETWICAGAIIINNISIGENDVIGAGAVVIKNIDDNNSTFVGVPIRKI